MKYYLGLQLNKVRKMTQRVTEFIPVKIRMEPLCVYIYVLAHLRLVVKIGENIIMYLSDCIHD